MPVSRPSPSLSRGPAVLATAARLRRSPLAYWLVAAAVAVLTGLVAAHAVAGAAAERSRLGGLRPALVATRSLPAGHRLRSGDTTIRSLPAGALPAGTVDDHRNGAVLVVPVVGGEVVSESKLAPAGLGPVAGLLPPGTRGLAVPDGGTGLRLAPGDVVDVLATFPPEAASDREPTFAVADGAVVVDVVEDAVTVAVGEAEAPRVAFALTQGVVTLALSGDR